VTIPSGSDTSPVQVTLISDGQHSITASYSGDAVYNPASSQPFVLTITAPFSIGAATPALSVVAGQTATFNLKVINALPNSFAGTVALSCTSPAGTTCTVNPATVNLSATAIQVPASLNVATTLSAGLKYSPFNRLDFGFASVFAGLLLLGGKKPRRVMIGTLALLFIVGVSSCGGGSGSSSNSSSSLPTNAKVVVTGTSGTQTTSTQLALTITR
jgi:hypothetical protein